MLNVLAHLTRKSHLKNVLWTRFRDIYFRIFQFFGVLSIFQVLIGRFGQQALKLKVTWPFTT